MYNTQPATSGSWFYMFVLYLVKTSKVFLRHTVQRRIRSNHTEVQ